MSDRVILHCDCNSFFASVETAINPAYRGVPMAVCGSVEDRHGIVLAKNELARAAGVKTAETVYSARRKCPSLVIAEPHYDEYARYSRLVNDIYYEYTDLVEPFGIDESWLDVTASGRVFGTGPEIADKIRERVKREIGITVSVGVSFNKVFAKLGSDYKKPDAVTVISRENFRDIVFPLPVGDLLFVGRKTEDALMRMGIRTIGALAEADASFLVRKFGKAGEMLHRYAAGLDDAPVEDKRHEDAKSVSNGFTFRHDLVGREECRVGIDFLSEEIGRRLRRSGQRCATVAITIKDEYLVSIQRQMHIDPPTDIGREIADAAYKLFCREWSEHRPVRMLTVSATSLMRAEAAASQISMFEDNSAKREKSLTVEKTVDKIRERYGNGSIVSGAVMDSDIGIFAPKTREKN
ncbi:MAG: DNA polymerase IV [Clostridia bacterium]|nr:DNA polymerase IV [Clostridia bacterium]